MRTYSLKIRILLPLTLVGIVLLGAFVVIFYRFQERHMMHEVAARLQAVKKLFSGQLESDAGMMGAAAHLILRDEALKAALTDKDKRALLELTQTLFGQLQVQHGITHFYFTGPDRINILRVHKPDKDGDEIKRFTMLEAEKTGKTASGIELGPLGTLTLRVVEPWYDRGKLIGYVELGEEVQHITRKLSEILDVEIYVLVEKDRLDRLGWEAGMRMLGRKAEWDRFPSEVIIDQTHDVFPKGLKGYVGEDKHTSMVTDVETFMDGRRYRTGFIHIDDAGGRSVGDLVVSTDVTDLVADLKDTFLVVGVISFILGGGLFLLFYFVVERVERQMATAGRQLTRVRKAVESTGEAVIMVDESLKVTYHNRAALELFGYTPEQMNAAGGLSILYANSAIARRISDVVTHGNSWQGEAEVRTREDRRLWVALRADAIRGDDGRILELVIIHTDISQRRQAEEALRESEQTIRGTLNSTADGILVVNEEGNVIHTNERFVQMWQIPAELIGTKDDKKLLDYVLDQLVEPEAFLSKVQELYESSKEDFDTIYFKDRRVFERFSCPLIQEGKIAGRVWSFRDVTERRRLAAEIQQMQKLEAIGTLAGGIAHDFNNLLMGIQGNISLLLMNRDTSDPEYKRLKDIERQIESGARLTSHLLGYARKGKYEVTPLDLNQLVVETSETFGRTRKDITVHHELDQGIFAIEADPAQIEQVLWNLYVNAADAMGSGGKLALKTANRSHENMTGKLYDPKPGRYVLLTVTDTGVGMDKETMERVFDPFFTTKEMGRGTGLGLASAYGIVKAHGGYIDVASKEGEGTTFSVYLPATEKEVPSTVSIPERLAERTGRVLLVDDEEVIRQIGRELLEALGYQVLLAKDGEEAVEIYRKNSGNLDLVILDMIMPGLGGGQAYDTMKAINPGIKVLLSSGYNIEGQATEILDRGCDGFIQKPFTIEELSRRIGEILDET